MRGESLITVVHLEKLDQAFKKTMLGETAWQWTMGNEIDLLTNLHIHQLVRHLKNYRKIWDLGVHDIVPAYHSFAVYFSEHIENGEEIADIIDAELAKKWRENQSDEGLVKDCSQQVHNLPVEYSGLDLDRVANLTQMTIGEIIQRHQRPIYHVALVGFLPHFPYLLGLDKALEIPRLESPRKRIMAGSVAIAGKQAGVYPVDSPGGWNILGVTDPQLLTEILPGDKVCFKLA